MKDGISIVMSYFDRKEQLLLTLSSIQKSSYDLNKLEIIIVNDNSNNIDDVIHEFSNLNIITYYITDKEKTWKNPCVVYNIGFNLVHYDKVIIQNPETYHQGDVLKYVYEHLTDENYITFACYSISQNEYNYNKYNYENIIYVDKKFTSACSDGWYNHPVYIPSYLHFCSALSYDNLCKLNGFDEKYKNGYNYDDNEILHRIKILGLKLEIISNPHVLHQWHDSPSRWYSNTSEEIVNKKRDLIKINKNIYENNTLKKNTYHINGNKFFNKNEIKLSVIVININNLEYTKNCINDLLNQTTYRFNITLVDQGSVEDGTHEYLNNLPEKINIIKNTENVSLHKLWNDFYLNSNTEYLCFLNNDVKLTDNFIEDTLDILDNNTNVGIVVHSTNSMYYNKKSDVLEYKNTKRRIKQGWDYTIRKELYTKIPTELKFYYGDDWLFHSVYERGYNVVTCISSPIIHYGSKSIKYSPINYLDETKSFNSYGLIQYLPHYSEYTEVVPTYLNFNDIVPEIYIGSIDNCDDNEIYTEHDTLHNYNVELLKSCGIENPNSDTTIDYNNIKQYYKDTLKIKISYIINDGINKGYKKIGFYDSLIKYILPLYLEHIREYKIF